MPPASIVAVAGFGSSRHRGVRRCPVLLREAQSFVPGFAIALGLLENLAIFRRHHDLLPLR